ncbi:uncharacterized protein DC041_0004926 [Schistosoma bovis]|uniref:Aminopeptidase N-like N-terminal domain-containing protein n=1 Tax=Schistosoma bovis TaxID=6184 RepID=A0A430QM11_SCHBO|nr:uncharacterized protein DC041_0004926 [Schistosoma bovis]
MNLPDYLRHYKSFFVFWIYLENVTDDLLQRALESLSNRSMKDVRLPYTIIPSFYDLKLQVHLHQGKPETFFFNGSVTIKIYCSISTKHFFVHAHSRLNISLDKISITILSDDGNTHGNIDLKNISYEEDLEWYRIELVHSLQPFTYYELTFGQFRSALNDELKGWYLSKYIENGTYK